MTTTTTTTTTSGAAYAALPEPHHRGPAGTGNYFSSFTADQMRAFADATCAMRASHGQASAGATLPEGWVPLVITHEGQYPEEIAYGPQRMMDRLDKWLRKYFDSVVAAAPTTQPAPQQEPSHTAVRLAELVLSDCGHSSNYTPLLDRVAARIDAHVERRLDELRGCLESNPAPSPAAQAAECVPAEEREKERIAFKDAHRHLELDEVPDAWGRPMFKHSHIEASWLGWIARAAQEGKK